MERVLVSWVVHGVRVVLERSGGFGSHLSAITGDLRVHDLLFGICIPRDVPSRDEDEGVGGRRPSGARLEGGNDRDKHGQCNNYAADLR
jgi:hypothetical protein